MKIQKIRKMNRDELDTQLKQLKEEFCNLRFQLALGKISDTSKIGKVKKNIAQINTIISEKFLLKINDIKTDIVAKVDNLSE